MALLHNTTRPHAAPEFATSVILLANRAIASMLLWQFRARSRRQLAQMDNHQLCDIGLNHALRNAETAKPFWQK